MIVSFLKKIFELKRDAEILSELDAILSLAVCAEEYNLVKPVLTDKHEIIIKDGKDYIRAIKPEFEFLEYALDEAFRYSDKVGVMFWGFPEMIRYNDDTKTTSLRLYVFEKRYTDKLSACADLNMKDKIELQSFCDEIFGDG